MVLYNLESAKKTAEYLLQIKAIKINPANPFTWASGWKSPIYCDNRKTLSFPPIRTYLRQEMVKCINEHFATPDMIAGVATGGIAMGVLVAQDLGLPFVYVRSESKGHGLQNRIEGHVESGSNVIVIEDLISTGGSSISVVESLREAGCNVVGMVAIFTYGFDVARKKFKDAKCPLYTLSDYETIIQIALENGLVSGKQQETLKEWRIKPEEWGK
jgi:orotate phosphoribosyltransferase